VLVPPTARKKSRGRRGPRKDESPADAGLSVTAQRPREGLP
jgi:hypothetical protein